MVVLNLELAGADRDVRVRNLVIAGWAGRDQASVQAHIQELLEIGVPPPSTTPLFYRVSASRLTTEPSIESLGSRSSGEVEIALLRWGGEYWVGVGSDHTDREAESHSVALSKQLCEKPLGRRFWRYSRIRAHWDQLILRSYILKGDERIAYQQGRASDLLPPERLMECMGQELSNGGLMFCGTVPALNGIVEAEALAIELHDPVLNQTLTHEYRSISLPVIA